MADGAAAAGRTHTRAGKDARRGTQSDLVHNAGSEEELRPEVREQKSEIRGRGTADCGLRKFQTFDVEGTSLFQQPLVLVVSANPKPVKRTFVHASEGAPATRDTSRRVLALALEVQRRMPRVLVPKAICLSGLAPNFRRQRIVPAPELTRRRGLHRAAWF